MNLYRNILSVVVLTAFFKNPAAASGIPTVDVATVGQLIASSSARAQEYKVMLEQAKSRLDQLKKDAEYFEEMIEGYEGYEKVLVDIAANSSYALDNWKSIYDEGKIITLRAEFGMYSDNSSKQAAMDRELMSFAVQRDYYTTAVNRNKKMSGLLAAYSGADTPLKRESIANAINFEQMRIQNDMAMMDSMKIMMEKQLVLEADERASNNIEASLKPTITLITE